MLEKMSGMIGAHAPRSDAPFNDTLQTLESWEPFEALTSLGLAAMEAAGSVFDPGLQPVGHPRRAPEH